MELEEEKVRSLHSSLLEGEGLKDNHMQIKKYYIF
jgi:hypothetical protein